MTWAWKTSVISGAISKKIFTSPKFIEILLKTCCATNRKVAGSIPAGVSGFFIDIILPIAIWPWGRLSL